jgi:DNA transformation protein
MPVTPSYLTYVIDQLAGVGPVVAKRMFGGIGLYQAGAFFGLIDEDVVYLRVNDASRPEFVKRGMQPLRPVRSKPSMTTLNYYQLPDDVLDDPDQLRDWAQRAVKVAASAPPRRRGARASKSQAGKAASEKRRR